MTQKTISLPEDLYFKLKAKKKKAETFPDLISRLIEEADRKEKTHKIMDLAGAFGDDSNEWEKLSRNVHTFDALENRIESLYYEWNPDSNYWVFQLVLPWQLH